MADFNKHEWCNATKLDPWEHMCWNCGNMVSSIYGYTNHAESQIYICPHCKSFFFNYTLHFN